MVFINVYATNEQNKDAVIDWLIERLYEKGEVSLINMLEHHMDKVSVEDNDMLSWWDVGWNYLDILDLHKAKYDSNELDIPRPKCRYWKHYT